MHKKENFMNQLKRVIMIFIPVLNLVAISFVENSELSNSLSEIYIISAIEHLINY